MKGSLQSTDNCPYKRRKKRRHRYREDGNVTMETETILDSYEPRIVDQHQDYDRIWNRVAFSTFTSQPCKYLDFEMF